MESWRNGRHIVAEELMKAYDLIGTNMERELDHEKNIFIERDKLRALRDKASRVDELEDEVANHALQRRALDSRNNDTTQLLKQKATENDRLTEENARLAEEIQGHKAVATRVEDLEQENQRLAAELQKSLQRLRDLDNEGQYNVNDTPATKGVTNSARMVDNEESDPVPATIYHALVAKYNAHCESYNDLKVARQKLEDTLRDVKIRIKDWSKYSDRQEKAATKREDKIRDLEDQVRLLNEQLGNGSTATATALSSPIKRPSGLANSEEDHTNLADTSKPLVSSGLTGVNGALGRADNITNAPDSPRGKDRVPHSHRIEVGRSPSLEVRESGHVDEVQNTHDGSPDSPELPMLLSGADAGIDDTQFLNIEPHNSSSTEGDVDINSPQVVGEHNDGNNQKSMIRMPSSPDVPVFIEARSVKKRKGRKQSVETPPAPKIKVEIVSSSPIGIAAFHRLDPNESIDLDELGDKQMTPRKQRTIQRHYGRVMTREADFARRYRSESLELSHPTFEQAFEQRSQSIPADITPVHERSILQPRSTNQTILPRTSDDRAPKRRRIASDQAIGELMEDGENAGFSVMRSKQTNNPGSAVRLAHLLDNPSPLKHVITPHQRPTDRPNMSITRRIERLSARTYETGPAGDFRARHLTAGDIPPSRSSSKEEARPSTKDTFKDSAYGSRPASRSKPLYDDFALPQARPLPWDSVNTPKPPLKTYTRLPATTGKIVTKKTVAKRQSLAAQEIFRAEVDHPANEPLRCRPLDKLSIEDFKINPAFNQGYTYAFGEVVRNRTDRACLPGCTKPACCGNKFRAFASAMTGRDPNKTPTSSQEEADLKTLTDFMGDNAYKLRNMTSPERKEMLLQAQTRQLANKHGRHRQAYERRASPPGFWRIDFPTTQEEEEDRVLRVEYKRELVRQRYEEAMRPGGRYLFRDE